MKKKNDSNKVYCINCKYVYFRLDTCKHVCFSAPKDIPTPIELTFHEEWCDDKNSSNNCEDYKEKFAIKIKNLLKIRRTFNE